MRVQPWKVQGVAPLGPRFQRNYMSLKEFLKSHRIKAKLSQKKLANKLGYSCAQFVSNWERGISSPPLSRLSEISKIIKIPPKKLQSLWVEEKKAIYAMRMVREIKG